LGKKLELCFSEVAVGHAQSWQERDQVWIALGKETSWEGEVEKVVSLERIGGEGGTLLPGKKGGIESIHRASAGGLSSRKTKEERKKAKKKLGEISSKSKVQKAGAVDHFIEGALKEYLRRNRRLVANRGGKKESSSQKGEKVRGWAWQKFRKANQD